MGSGALCEGLPGGGTQLTLASVRAGAASTHRVRVPKSNLHQQRSSLRPLLVAYLELHFPLLLDWHQHQAHVPLLSPA